MTIPEMINQQVGHVMLNLGSIEIRNALERIAEAAAREAAGIAYSGTHKTDIIEDIVAAVLGKGETLMAKPRQKPSDFKTAADLLNYLKGEQCGDKDCTECTVVDWHEAKYFIEIFAAQSVAKMERELERWRHGQQIEGDYVCPNALELERLKEKNAALAGLGEQMNDHQCKECNECGCHCVCSDDALVDPLPASKQVTLSAKQVPCSCGGRVEIRAAGVLTKVFHDSDYKHLPQGAVTFVRDTYGIEPEVKS